jgi:hypothetical protein
MSIICLVVHCAEQLSEREDGSKEVHLIVLLASLILWWEVHPPQRENTRVLFEEL